MKRLFLSFALVGGFIAAMAQNPDNVGIGPRIGMNLSNIANGENDSYEDATNNLNVGGVFGLAVNIPIGKVMSIQPEFLFSQKGARFTVKDGLLKDSYVALVSNYVEIPLLVKARLGGDKVYGFLQGGGYGGFWANSKLKTRPVVNGTKKDVTKDKWDFDKDRDQRADAGVVFGTGVGFGAGSGNIEIDLRYNLGLMDRIKKDWAGRLTDDKQMNRNFGLSVLYLF